MTLSLDIRRLGLMLLTLLVVLAVVGPSCLLFATQAMAMSDFSHVPAPVSGCGGPGSSMGACPHDNPIETTSSSTVDTPQVAQIAIVSVPIDALSMGLALLAPAERPPGAPVAHLTPLRI